MSNTIQVVPQTVENVFQVPGIQLVKAVFLLGNEQLLAAYAEGRAKEKYPKIKSLSTDAKLLVELDNGKNSFGLIERVRQGQGRPSGSGDGAFPDDSAPPVHCNPPPGSPRPRSPPGRCSSLRR